MEALLRDRRLLYVTGKGGVGKTTVAAALGLAAARAGRRTIVCEVAEQDRVSRAFRREGVVPESEVQLADNLWAITIDPQRALEEWLGKQIGGVGLRVIARSSAFQYFVAAAPGAKELITVAKVWELAQRDRWDKRNRTYDLVVVDAPSSGHGLAMLTTPRTFGEIARVGPIRRQAYKVREFLADPERTGYVAVALPEEMPVNETLELERRLPEAVGTGLEAIVVNGMWPDRFSAADAEAMRAAGRRPADDARRAHVARARARRSATTCAGCAARRRRRSSRSPTCSSPRSGSRSTRSSPATSRASCDRRAGPAAGVRRALVVARGAAPVLGRRAGRRRRGRPRSSTARSRCSCSWSRSSAWRSARCSCRELRWRRWRWDVRPDAIDIQHGTLTIRRTLVPMMRVQHVDTTRGILEQAFSLATVVVHTAAGSHRIPLLTLPRRRRAARADRRPRPHRR